MQVSVSDMRVSSPKERKRFSLKTSVLRHFFSCVLTVWSATTSPHFLSLNPLHGSFLYNRTAPSVLFTILLSSFGSGSPITFPHLIHLLFEKVQIYNQQPNVNRRMFQKP